MNKSQLSVLILILSIVAGCRNDESPVVKAVEIQLQKYPESTLKDIYKSFFQDEYGPGHLLDDTSAARKYFEYELSQMKSKGYYELEPCGLGNNFYRASMDLVVDGLLTADDFFIVFTESAEGFRLPEIEGWKLKWGYILKELTSMQKRINNFEEDLADISAMLERGEYIVHHSQIYTECYNPHYRIVRKGN